MFRYNLPEKYRILDGSALKIIACITMLIDHMLFLNYLAGSVGIKLVSSLSIKP